MNGHRMSRVTAVAVFTLLLLTAYASHCDAQNARQRQAAAQAYDRGTTAYVDQSYEEAARWFETANRLAPAAPALMQAIRAHERNDSAARAATLALDLQTTYREDTSAAAFAQSILDKTSGSLLRVQVTCDEDCKLDLDGKLEEHLTFFVSPDRPHQLVATFETGSQSAEIRGAAGETKELSFAAPPAPTREPIAGGGDATQPSRTGKSHPPLSPVVTWIGVGVTVALGVATIVSGVDTTSKVPGYEKAANEYKVCTTVPTNSCEREGNTAKSLLEAGQGRETRTNILIGVTAAAAVGTSVLAFALTDWSGSPASHPDRDTRDQGAQPEPAARHHWFAGLSIVPQVGGAATVLKGRF
jgi:hypothetical protein